MRLCESSYHAIWPCVWSRTCNRCEVTARRELGRGRNGVSLRQQTSAPPSRHQHHMQEILTIQYQYNKQDIFILSGEQIDSIIMPGFEPKTPVSLNPPKDDPISIDHLSKCDGTHEGYPTYVAIKVRIFIYKSSFPPGRIQCFFRKIQETRVNHHIHLQSARAPHCACKIYCSTL